jgi:hypothetical protein
MNATTNTKPPRDLRLDLFRGLALFMVLINHSDKNPLTIFTFRSFGFSDAAEIFVFISGISCGIAYSRMLARQGWQSLLKALGKRSAQIYVCYAAACVAFPILGFIGTRQGIDISDLGSYLVSGLLLWKPVGLGNVLLLYLWLTLLVVPLFLIGVKHSVRATLLVSALIWLLPQLFPTFFDPVTSRYFFNPFAWQLLFVVGMMFGLKHQSPAAAGRSSGWPNWMVSAAWGIVLASFAYKFSLFVLLQTGHDISWLRLPRATNLMFKENLSALRIVHFFSAAILISTYLPRTAPVLEWLSSKIAIKVGSRSLEMYGLSILLSTLLTRIFVLGHLGMAEKLALDVVAISLMATAGLLIGKPRLPTLQGV